MIDPWQATEVTVFESGEEILAEGRECSFFFVILSGQVALSTDGKKIRMLGEQDVIGLESLFLKEPSHYSAKAWQECRVAKYGPQTIDHYIYETPRMVRNVLGSILRQLTQTTLNLADDPQPGLADNERVRFYKDGEIVLGETSGTDLYRLISTEGGLMVTTGDRDITHINKPGEFFGVPVSGARACVKSIGESVVEKYDTGDLDIIVRDYPESAVRIMHAMLERLPSK